MTNLFDDKEETGKNDSELIEVEILEDDEEEFEEEEAKWNDEFFPFRVEDEYVVAELVKLVRGIITDKNLSPYQLRQIAVVLYALEHLPRRVAGISIGLNVVYRLNNESSSCEFYISENEFRLSSGGYVYNEGVGGDSYGSIAFELETSGYRDGDSQSYETLGWFGKMQELLQMDSAVEFEDNGDDSDVDWHTEPNADDWNTLYELQEKLGY